MGAVLSPYSLAIQYERGLYLSYSYSIALLLKRSLLGQGNSGLESSV